MSERLYYHFADLENVPIDADDISDLDCFHPSWQGEALISHVVWEQGPFSE